MPVYQLHRTQEIAAPLNEVWQFIAAPANLKRITPDYMGFDVIGEIPTHMYAGMIISYHVRPILGIKMRWVTEITHVKENEYFVDEQRVGPYTLWHHQHTLQETKNGVLMTDLVTYQPPLHFLGAIANHLFIKKQLETIFVYRKKALEDIFGAHVNTVSV